jgi:hypothetical protein
VVPGYLSPYLKIIHEFVVELLIQSAELPEFANKVGLVLLQSDSVVELREAFVPDVIDDVHLFQNPSMGYVSLLLLLLAVSSASPLRAAGEAAEGSSKYLEIPIIIGLSLFQLLGDFFFGVAMEVRFITTVKLSHVDFIGNFVVGFELSETSNE